jgi:hypothetical protein
MGLPTRNRLVSWTNLSRRGQAVIQTGNDDAGSGIIDVEPALVKSPLYRWRCIMRPLNLGLIVLAVAVALWGFAYKLSLYNPDQNRRPTISVAKLWLGPEGTLFIVKNKPKCQLQLKWTLDSVLTQQFETFPDAPHGMLGSLDASVVGKQSFTASAPRSPPPHMG